MTTTMRGIVTPEAVVLDFETAGIASRALARVLDAVIQGAALFALLVLVGFAIPGSAGIVVAIVGVALVVLGYPVLCETLMRGRSPGKAALGLRVVTTEGAPVAFRHAFIRSTLGVVDFLLPPGGLFAVITSLLSPRGQRLGDLVAGTIVLRERTALTPSGAVWFNPPAGLIGYAQSLDVSVVTDPQFAVVRGFLLRVQDLVPEARFAMAVRLSTPIAAAMHHTIPNGMHPEQFLVCVAAAHQRRGTLPTPGPTQAPAPAIPPPPPVAPPGPPPPPPAFRPPPRSQTGPSSPAGFRWASPPAHPAPPPGVVTPGAPQPVAPSSAPAWPEPPSPPTGEPTAPGTALTGELTAPGTALTGELTAPGTALTGELTAPGTALTAEPTAPGTAESTTAAPASAPRSQPLVADPAPSAPGATDASDAG